MNVASVLPLDTTPEALRAYYGHLQRLGPTGRWDLMFRLQAQHRDWLAAGVRSRHPEYSAEQVRLAVIRLTVGEELFRQAYPGCDVMP